MNEEQQKEALETIEMLVKEVEKLEKMVIVRDAQIEGLNKVVAMLLGGELA